MKKSIIMNIQKFCVHDGPGIRTTIFFKGCPLNCIWCHNPESQRFNKEIMFDYEKCSKCGECIKRCKSKALSIKKGIIHYDPSLCNFCGVCIDFCINNARSLVGKVFSVSELLKEIEKDMIFYEESGGGVTLSGGEAMEQIDFIKDLVKQCKSKGISIAIDTCGYTPFENFEKIFDYVDIFLYDIKLINSNKHKKYVGVYNELILKNLKKLSDKGANIHLRLPLIEPINTSDDDIYNLLDYLKDINISKINLLPYHKIGGHKYKKLNIKYDFKSMKKPSDKRLEEIKLLFKNNNYNVKIGG
ncbi:MAG: glycyl-radical enzyme activating protein [Firmicutes bacterium]|nr:glycyl-radical enzyme activating protein [Bacillota bacterium]